MYFLIKKSLLVSGSSLTSGMGRPLTEPMHKAKGVADWPRCFVTWPPVLYFMFGLTKGTSSFSLMKSRLTYSAA